MADTQETFFKRIDVLEPHIAYLGGYLREALLYLSRDPQSSLTKSRIVLEKILFQILNDLLGRSPKRPMIASMLEERQLLEKIPRRILNRMNSIREMSNLGPHGEHVTQADASRVMADLLDVLEWYVTTPRSAVSMTTEARESIEILSELRKRYPQYLREELISVKFVQSANRCYLETTTLNVVADYLRDEMTKRDDLGFITDGDHGEKLYFDPQRSISENVHRFIFEFDEISIVNCTDLFRADLPNEIYAAWQEGQSTSKQNLH